jgi:hypothetical protein
MKANDFGMIVHVSNPKIKTLKLLTIRRKKMSALPIRVNQLNPIGRLSQMKSLSSSNTFSLLNYHNSLINRNHKNRTAFPVI